MQCPTAHAPHTAHAVSNSTCSSEHSGIQHIQRIYHKTAHTQRQTAHTAHAAHTASITTYNAYSITKHIQRKTVTRRSVRSAYKSSQRVITINNTTSIVFAASGAIPFRAISSCLNPVPWSTVHTVSRPNRPVPSRDGLIPSREVPC